MTTADSLSPAARHLLSLAKTIRHYEEALIRTSGERFNLFDVLHVGHYEVRTHSPILAELLDPRGSHGQGPCFLQLFLTQVGIQDFDAACARVAIEVSIGDLGRLDIVITDKNNHRSIFIENKIYAGLQKDQLTRYHTHDKSADLLFLTLRGDPPADGTDKSVVPNLKRVSYKNDIVRWLEACRKEAVTAPGVRETITQYINLINRLTQQNTSTNMKHQLTEAVLKDKDSFLAYTELCNVKSEIHASVLTTLEEKVKNISSQLGLVPNFPLPLGDLSKTYKGIGFSSSTLQQYGVGIRIEFGRSNYGNCYFGFHKLNKDLKCPLTQEIQNAFKDEFGPPFANESWPAFAYWDDHRDWDDETFADIQFGSFAIDLEKLIKRLVNVATQASAK